MIKILIVGQFENPITPGWFAGGTERAEQLQASTLANIGHDVTLATLPTQYVPHKYSLYFIDPTKNAPQNCAAIADMARSFDLVISHAKRPGTIKHLAVIPNVHHVLHVMPSIFGMVGLGIMEGMYLGYQNGHTVYCVSEYHRAETLNYMHTRKAFKGQWFEIDSRPFPQLVTERRYTIQPNLHRTNPVAIGRMHPEKQLDLARDAGFTIYATQPDPQFPEARTGLSYRVIMSQLARAGVNISTWPSETMGRTPFEAACRGVPSVIHSKKGKHASTEYLPTWAYSVVDSHRVRRPMIVEMIKGAAVPLQIMEDSKRQQLANHMWDRYNPYQHQKDLLKILGL